MRLIELAPAEQQGSLRAALAAAEVGADVCSCGCGSFFIDYAGQDRGKHVLVAEGFVDRPGLPALGVLLFGAKGRPAYLELYAPERVDGDPPLRFPQASEIHA